MNDMEMEQREICKKNGSEYVPSEPFKKLGIAMKTMEKMPINALRHPAESDTCGWYIWAGETFSEDPDFFQPLHVMHISEKCPEIIPYFGLAPGWRVLLSAESVDVWFDKDLLNV
jgi:hypothetical protein